MLERKSSPRPVAQNVTRTGQPANPLSVHFTDESSKTVPESDLTPPFSVVPYRFPAASRINGATEAPGRTCSTVKTRPVLALLILKAMAGFR